MQGVFRFHSRLQEVAVIKDLAGFFAEFLRLLPALLPRFVGAFVLAFVVISLGGGMVRLRMRHHVTRFDTAIRHWARGLRYRDHENLETERVSLSWFFRFWTNFASAPSLSFFSLAVPIYFYQRATQSGLIAEPPAPFAPVPFSAIWLLPGLCYAGSMLLSFIVKRVFKRVRPPREGFAFGHKLKDPSFPSGHSLTSFCFWIMCAVVVSLRATSLPLALGFWLLAIAIVGLTGLSRVYLGVHFPSDVLGGYLMGALWCASCYVAIGPILWRGY